jgi:2-desacetyl-2-hydroxyethyl bacteriochlorophyllide A dehydrogenase
MKALRYTDHQLSVSEVPKPETNGEAVVRVTLSGICNTDLEIARGYAGFEGTLGHEFAGVIEQLPAEPLARDLTPGQRVVGEINAGCGKCKACRLGDSRHCARRTVLGIVGRDGAHAEFLKLPVTNLVPVPDAIPDERAVFTEPLAAACGILERVSITPEMKVAVIGDGKLGLLCAQVLMTTRARVTLVGKHENKLSVAGRKGAQTIRADQRTLPKHEFDVVIEASGSPSGFSLALDLLRPRGTLVLKSTFQGPGEVDTTPIVVSEISVVGSRCGRFAPALQLLETETIDTESLIAEEFPLINAVQAMERASEPGILKVLLRP